MRLYLQRVVVAMSQLSQLGKRVALDVAKFLHFCRLGSFPGNRHSFQNVIVLPACLVSG
jgi:hypothetical protein